MSSAPVVSATARNRAHSEADYSGSYEGISPSYSGNSRCSEASSLEPDSTLLDAVVVHQSMKFDSPSKNPFDKPNNSNYYCTRTTSDLPRLLLPVQTQHHGRLLNQSTTLSQTCQASPLNSPTSPLGSMSLIGRKDTKGGSQMMRSETPTRIGSPKQVFMSVDSQTTPHEFRSANSSKTSSVHPRLCDSNLPIPSRQYTSNQTAYLNSSAVLPSPQPSPKFHRSVLNVKPGSLLSPKSLLQVHFAHPNRTDASKPKEPCLTQNPVPQQTSSRSPLPNNVMSPKLLRKQYYYWSGLCIAITLCHPEPNMPFDQISRMLYIGVTLNVVLWIYNHYVIKFGLFLSFLGGRSFSVTRILMQFPWSKRFTQFSNRLLPPGNF